MVNRHAESCGLPPQVTNDKSNNYFGYYENNMGEQWIFVYDRDTKKAVLRGGDVGWEDKYEVRNGIAVGLILNQSEQNWLKVCWQSVNELS